MFIKNVNKNVADVFMGKGWGHWVRIQRSGTIITRIAGTATPDEKLMSVLKNKVRWS